MLKATPKGRKILIFADNSDYAYGPIRTSGQVLNVITFLTKTKLSRQVRDILKKTKGVIIITIALHVLLVS